VDNLLLFSSIDDDDDDDDDDDEAKPVKAVIMRAYMGMTRWQEYTGRS